ncbi:MAG TPA: Uma2 family endonuclease [Aggregatilineales bacterium]|nr:Uma2 family endonuclease [Aggregatilineales bacterium]
MAVQERLYTAADLLALSVSGKRYELVEGHLIEMSPAGKAHGLLTLEIGYRLKTFTQPRDLGQVFGAETGFKVAEAPDTVYGVDVAFVSKARAQQGEDYFTGAPDLAVEVISPGNTQTEMHEKVMHYFRAGAHLVWIVYS